MSATQPAAATPTPGSDARESTDDEQPVAAASLFARVKRLLQRAATAALDTPIAILQWLRRRIGGVADTDQGAGDDAAASPRGRKGGRHAADEAPAEAAEVPASRRPLRSALVYIGVLLAGGVTGVILDTKLREEPPARESVASLVPAAPPAENAETPATAETDVAEAPAAPAEAESSLAEAQAARVEAEKALATFRAESVKDAAAQKKKLDEAEQQLVSMRATASAAQARRSSSGGGGEPDRQRAPVKSGNCVMRPGDVSALKGCLADFNR
jgi:hypothetical protein